jgi:hypothetical protein
MSPSGDLDSLDTTGLPAPPAFHPWLPDLPPVHADDLDNDGSVDVADMRRAQLMEYWAALWTAFEQLEPVPLVQILPRSEVVDFVEWEYLSLNQEWADADPPPLSYQRLDEYAQQTRATLAQSVKTYFSGGGGGYAGGAGSGGSGGVAGSPRYSTGDMRLVPSVDVVAGIADALELTDRYQSGAAVNHAIAGGAIRAQGLRVRRRRRRPKLLYDTRGRRRYVRRRNGWRA